jgi:hypothetical protein
MFMLLIEALRLTLATKEVKPSSHRRHCGEVKKEIHYESHSSVGVVKSYGTINWHKYVKDWQGKIGCFKSKANCNCELSLRQEKYAKTEHKLIMKINNLVTTLWAQFSMIILHFLGTSSDNLSHLMFFLKDQNRM